MLENYVQKNSVCNLTSKNEINGKYTEGEQMPVQNYLKFLFICLFA